MAFEDYIREAELLINHFQKNPEPLFLTRAYQALENVFPPDEPDREAWSRIRAEALRLWLSPIEEIEINIDPGFDPEDEPEAHMQPPPTKSGVVYPPGADSALIDDPVARARYEEQIAENNEKIENYGFHTKMHRLEERVFPRAEKFILDLYAPNASDRKELKTLSEKILSGEKRRRKLCDLLSPTKDAGSQDGK